MTLAVFKPAEAKGYGMTMGTWDEQFGHCVKSGFQRIELIPKVLQQQTEAPPFPRRRKDHRLHEQQPLSTEGLASFPRRSAAFTLDGLILFILGQVIGWSFSPWLFEIGHNGRWIGLGIFTFYFGAYNSWLTSGRTIGKHFMKIMVVGRDGQAVGLFRALMRATVLGIPIFFYGWGVSAFGSHPNIRVLQSVIVFGLAGGLLYTLMFNWKTRQVLHDLVSQTYVIRTDAQPSLLPESPQHHYYVVAGIMLVVLLLPMSPMGIDIWAPIRDVPIQSLELAPLTQSLMQNSRFAGAEVRTVKEWPLHGGQEVREVVGEVFYTGKLTAEEITAITKTVVEQLFKLVPNVNEYHYVSVRIVTVWDLGIANGSNTQTSRQTVAEWKRRGLGHE